jgi:hypothetical protein
VSTKIVAKQWVNGLDSPPIILGSITSYKLETRENIGRLKNLIYERYPKLDFFTLHHTQQQGNGK